VRECAFCPSTAKLSAEHIISKWMDALFTGPLKARIEDSAGFIREWESESNSLDYRAKVVCRNCNNTWMSDIENGHAKPVMTPLIKGESAVAIGSSEAHSLALFAFKTAVVLDHANRRVRAPFFSPRIRHAFRRSLAIPNITRMWLCGFDGHRNARRIQTVYLNGKVQPTYPIQMYVLTFGVGCFVFQVLSAKHFGSITLEPYLGFERLAIPFWPTPPLGLDWPHCNNLSSDDEFDGFAFRWGRVVGYPRYSPG
jgi:hypothetical protein